METSRETLHLVDRESIAVVWLKRDLRWTDHAPINAATYCGLRTIIFFAWDDVLIKGPDFDDRHGRFILQSLKDMRQDAPTGAEVSDVQAEVVTILAQIQREFDIRYLLSHEENGTQRTWDRDRVVKKWCKANGVFWKEFQRDGVVRGIKSRDGWDQQWMKVMTSPCYPKPSKLMCTDWSNPFPLDAELLNRWEEPSLNFQPGGESSGLRYLKSFVDSRVVFYSKNISRPHDSRKSCARISPYLSWGNLSIRIAYQTMIFNKNKGNARAMNNAITRLHWHCHFIQKLETQCNYETLCINPAFEGLPREKRTDWILAWEEGRTGVPLVDACMRCLKATGWINFRMRAMVVSFLTHHLFQDWRWGAYHLAKMFLDYDPGIHYPQLQMQAGTTGANTIRLYNPVKNGQRFDEEGLFVRQWIPELSALPDKYIPEPSNMPPMEAMMIGFELGRDYPFPLVDLEVAVKNNGEKLYQWKKSQSARNYVPEILDKHVRKSNAPKKKPS